MIKQSQRHLLIALLAFVVRASGSAAGQTSEWVYVGPDGRLVYRSLPNGDHIMDFSFAGYRGGGVGLPNVAVQQTVSPSGGDDTAAIQAAVDAISSLPPDAAGFRGTVLLLPGTFNLSGTVNITTGGVVLRGSGSGSDGSIVNITGSPHLAINVHGSGSWQTVDNSASITDSYVPSGTNSFNVDNPSLFQVGDSVLIFRPVTADWVHFMGMDALVRDGQPQTWISVGGRIRTDRIISAISGNTITLDVPMTDSFDSQYLSPPGGTVVKYAFPGRISQVGVESLSMVAPPASGSSLYNALCMSAVINAWARDIAIQETDNSVTIDYSAKQVTLDSISTTHSASPAVSPPADFTVNGTQVFLNRCASNRTAGSASWPFVTGSTATGPIAILNFSSDQRSGISPHQRWATGLLADSAYLPNSPSGTPGLAFSNRGNLGSGHGWTIGWAVGWNVTSPFFLVQQPPGTENWCIGCVGTPVSRSMPGGDGTLLPNGIYDSLNSPVTPSSLYLAQMCDRLGPDAVANIGYPGSCGTTGP